MNISDTQVAECLDSVQGIMTFADENGFNDFNGLKNRFASLQNDFNELKSPVDESCLVKCAVVGAFSCGKSKFINSLLGEEIAPVEINPLTHGLTSFRYGGKEVITNDAGKTISRNKYVKDVQDISSAGSHFVVEHPGVPKGLEIIDSPGFSATRSDEAAAKKDMELSREAVRRADVVFFLIKIDEGTISKESLTYIQNTIDIEQPQPLYIVLTWGETKGKSERERIRNGIISQCRQNELPLENCVPYCSMSEEFLLDNYSEEYMLYFRECRKNMLKMCDEIKSFNKKQRGVYTSAKHQAFLQTLARFQSDFASIVSGFRDEVIGRKYDQLIKSAKIKYEEALEETGGICAKFCSDKAKKIGDKNIADWDYYPIGIDHEIYVKYDMADLEIYEEIDLFEKIKDCLEKKTDFIKNTPLIREQSVIRDIYKSVVTSLIKKHGKKRYEYWTWNAISLCKGLVATLKTEFNSSSGAFQTEIKKHLKPRFDQEEKSLKEKKQSALKKWDPLETRFSRLKIQ